jgi:hypothetical protein
MRPVAKMIYAITLLAVVAMASSASAYESFQSPSGNIQCGYSEDCFLRCDILQTANRPPSRPAECELEWGNAFEMSAGDGQAARICHGDTVMDPQSLVLNYGQSWSAGGFSCISSERGMSCRNQRGAGWDLSRASQKLH